MRILFLIITFFAIHFSLFAQRSQLGITVGGSLFKGDVNTSFALKETRPEVGFYYRFILSEHFALRSNLLFTTLSGSDYRDEGFSDKEINIKFRNLSFRSKVFEMNVLAEFYFLKMSAKHSPFIFAGTGLFYFNPQALYNGKWVNLQPLGTEGQNLTNTRYKRVQPAFITGLGYRFKLSESLAFGIEAGIRITRTDYIDDVSTTYADKSRLGSQAGIDLSDRSGELINNPQMDSYVAFQGGYVKDQYSTSGYRINGYGMPGDQRGAIDKDKYLIYNISLTYTLK